MCVLYVVIFHIHRLKDAWPFAVALDSADSWNELAEAALVHIDISIGNACLYVLIAKKKAYTV